MDSEDEIDAPTLGIGLVINIEKGMHHFFEFEKSENFKLSMLS